MMPLSHPRFPSGLLVLVGMLSLALTACDNAGPVPGDGVATALRIQIEPGTLRTPEGARAGDRITLDEVKLLLKTIKFNRVEDDEETEFKSEAVAVSLDLSGQPTTVAVTDVPPDTYRRVTFVIHKPEDTEPIPDPDFRDGPSGNDRYSVIVRGAVEGDPFELKIRESIQQQLDLDPPLTVEGGGGLVEVTLLADVAAWFVSEDGDPLDPRLEDDADEIADRIEDTFRALGR